MGTICLCFGLVTCRLDSLTITVSPRLSRSVLFSVYDLSVVFLAACFLSRAKLYTPPPPSPHLWPQGVFQGRGVGVYISRPPAARILYAPPSYTPPTPRRRACIKFGPIFLLGCRFSVACSCLLSCPSPQQAKVPAPIWLKNDSNKPLKSESRSICEATGSILHPVDDIETYVEMGAALSL